MNPLLWLANARIRQVREQAVDETVVCTLGENAPSYGSALVDIAETAFRRPPVSLHLIGVVESKRALAQRIRHMAVMPVPRSATVGVLGLVSIASLALLLLPMAKAEQQSAPAGRAADPARENALNEGIARHNNVPPGNPAEGDPAATPRRSVTFQLRLAEHTAAPGLTRVINDSSGRPIWLHERVELSEADVLCAQARNDEEGAYVWIQWTNNGKRKLAALTRDHLGKLLAFLVGGRVVSAPEMRVEIRSIRYELRGDLRKEEAGRLAADLSKMPWVHLPDKQRPEYGPEVEKRIRDVQGFEECWIDFDTEKIIGFDPALISDRLLEWSRESGLDAHYYAGGETLIGIDMVAYSIPDEMWTSRFDEALSSSIREFSDPGTPCNMSAKGDLPCTFSIVTREGGEGLLQILERMENPKALRVRYKLVEHSKSTLVEGWNEFENVLFYAGKIDGQRLTDVTMYEIGDDGVKRIIRAKDGEFSAANDDTDDLRVMLSMVKIDKDRTRNDGERSPVIRDKIELTLRPPPEFALVAF